MTLVSVVGAGLWYPNLPTGFTSNNALALSDTALLDATGEEYQMIGSVTVDGGGSKTFGGGSTALGWLAGTPITFLTDATVRVGVKASAVIDETAGPAARATIGTAAFSVYTDLVGGVDTITASTWYTTAMVSGTPFTVADGDKLAVCFQLTTTAGTPSVRFRQNATLTQGGYPAHTLVTTGPTYTSVSHNPNVILTFADGTLGWLEPSNVFTVPATTTATIGNTNIYGNVFRVPFSCTIDAIAAVVNATTNAANFALDLYSTPLGTPVLVEALTHDANVVMAAANHRVVTRRLTTPRTLVIGTDYAIGIRQTTATAVAGMYVDVDNAAHFKPLGMGAECYAANSTAGATFAAQNSGNRRYSLWMRISALDDGVSAGGGGGLRLVGTGGLVT